MQGAPKRQVNAEEMLAELKRALESSARAPDAPPRSASAAASSSSPSRNDRRSQIDGESDRSVKANVASPIGQPADLRKSARPGSGRWKLTVGALALTGVAAAGASYALINKASNPRESEPAVATAESLVRPQKEQAPEPLSSAGSATLVTSHRIGPDGAPIATAPSPPASPDPAPPLAEAPKTAAPSASQAITPEGAPIATAPPAPASLDSTPPLTEAPKTAASPSASQAIRPDGPPIATPPPRPASTDSTPHLVEAPKTAALSAASQTVRPDKAPIAGASPAPAANNSPPPPVTPKPNATRTASVPNDAAELSTPKVDAKKKPAEKPSPQKPLKDAKAPAKPIALAERQATEPAPAKEAERSPPPTQNIGNPAAAAPVPKPSVQQRVADGVTHAFGYLVHLPGALIPHLGGSNPDAH
jgi:hypothetical protein